MTHPYQPTPTPGITTLCQLARDIRASDLPPTTKISMIEAVDAISIELEAFGRRMDQMADHRAGWRNWFPLLGYAR